MMNSTFGRRDGFFSSAGKFAAANAPEAAPVAAECFRNNRRDTGSDMPVPFVIDTRQCQVSATLTLQQMPRFDFQILADQVR